MGKRAARIAGTVVVWGAVAGLSWIFSASGHFDSLGGMGLMIIGTLCTVAIWRWEPSH